MKSRIIKDYLAYLWLSFFHCSCDARPPTCGTCKNGRRHVSIHLIDPELPDSPTRNARQHSDLPDELEGHTNTLNMHRHAHGDVDVDGSNTPENVSVTPDLPARGAVSRMGEPEWPVD